MPPRAFGNERQHDVAGVAVREALTGRVLARVAVEHREVVLGGRELVHWYRHHVLLDLESGFLVEVVADARPVRQEVLDRHAVVDHRQIAAEDGAGGRRELEHAFLDQAHDGERREAFRPLASPKRVSTAFGISKPRCARPYALASSIRSPWSIRTTPENPVPDASTSSSPPRSDTRQTLAGACIRPARCGAHPAARSSAFPSERPGPSRGA